MLKNTSKNKLLNHKTPYHKSNLNIFNSNENTFKISLDQNYNKHFTNDYFFHAKSIKLPKKISSKIKQSQNHLVKWRQLQNRLDEKFGENMYTAKTPYKTMSTKTLFHHKKCGNDVELYPSNLVKAKGTGCPICAYRDRRLKKSTVQENLDKRYGKGRIKVLDYKTTNDPVKILDEKCGSIFYAKLYDMLTNIDCPKCGFLIKNRYNKKNKFTEFEVFKYDKKIDSFETLTKAGTFIFERTNKYASAASLISLANKKLKRTSEDRDSECEMAGYIIKRKITK